MSESDLVDQFSQDVDKLLETGSLRQAHSGPTAYRPALDLAQRLAATDFSGESRQRLALRHRLLKQLDVREQDISPAASAVPLLSWGLSRRLPVVLGLGVAVLLIHLAWSGTLQAGATQLNSTLHQSLSVSRVSQFLSSFSLAPTTPITPTLGIVAKPWPFAMRPEQVAISGVPAGGTTVPVGSVVSFGNPP